MIFESDIERFVVELLQKQGFVYLSPEEQEKERTTLSDVVLQGRLHQAIDRLNPLITQDGKDQALRQIRNLPTQNLTNNNETFHRSWQIY